MEVAVVASHYKKFFYLVRAPLSPIGTMCSGGLMVAIEAFLLKSQIGLAGEDMAYFRDPSQAVDSIKTMLISRNWKSLAGYYDLSRADNLDREPMISGDYFIRKERPEVAHPAGFWKYKHPFAPQFSYLSHRTFSEDIIEVTVYIEIDEGGGMTRRGMQSFHLQKSSKGYKLLPASDNRLPRAGAPDVPASGKFISEKKSVPEK